MVNESAGRENSVTSCFHEILFEEALKNDKVDVFIPLNGADRYYNADALFRAHDMFLLVESKSYERNIRDEGYKESACSLCIGLQNNATIKGYHRRCHYIMWARKQKKGGLGIIYSIYEDAVCNVRVLPHCSSLVSLPTTVLQNARQLAIDFYAGNAGLGKPEFFKYLDWLLHVRSGSTPDDGLPTTLYAISHAGGLCGLPFTSLSALAQWAAPALSKIMKEFQKRGPRP